MEQISQNPALPRSHDGSQNNSRANPAVISRGIQALFSAYRRDDFTDPEGFVAQLGTILADFSDEVVVYVTSPKTGLQRRMKWPPTISEVIDACEHHQEYLRRVRTQRPIAERLPPPSVADRPQGHLAQVFVPEGHARYDALVKWTETAEKLWWRFGHSSDGRRGLWVSWNAWTGGQPKTMERAA